MDVINFDFPSSTPFELPHPNKAASALVHNWESLPLIETLLDLAETEDYATVRAIFDYPLEHCPELLLLKLAQAKASTPIQLSEQKRVLPFGVQIY